MKDFLIYLISLYQRWISPHKGFRCAHAALHDGPSCSQAVKSILSECGPLRGWPLIRERLAECRFAYRELQDEDPDSPRRRRRRNGDDESCLSDFDCGEPDLCCIAEAGCDVLDCMPGFHGRWH